MASGVGAVKRCRQTSGPTESKVWNALRNHRLLAELHLDKVEYDTMVDAAYMANREAAIESLKQEYGDRESVTKRWRPPLKSSKKLWTTSIHNPYRSLVHT